MFFLHGSNRTENLARQLVEVIALTGGPSLFCKTLFLVQSRGMERMLSQYLTDTFGVWGNSAYLLPMQFIDHLCGSLNLEFDSCLFDRSVLTWRLEELLRTADDPVLQPIAGYLRGDQQEIKRFQLASRIAHLFDQYQIMRPDYIAAWDDGRLATDNPAELWQRYLWQQLRGLSGDAHRGEIISALIRHLGQGHRRLEGQLSQLYVFGLHTLPPLFMAALHALSGRADVHFFLLSPCSLYWADMESKKARLTRMHDAVKNDLPTDEHDHFHPLLESLGRQGADFQDLLLDSVDDLADGSESYEFWGEQPGKTLLQRLQDDLLEGRSPETAEPGGERAADESIVIVSCHSKMREIAVLKDYILKWLFENPDLGLHDIVVMAPDVQEYADLIPAFFGDIAHDLSDCRTRRDNRYFDVFLKFLDLFSSRYSITDVLGLLEQPELGSSFSISPADLELIWRWLKEAGVRWGISAQQRSEDGLFDSAAATWLSGLERILIGIASGSGEMVDDLLPFAEIEGSDAETIASLCHFIEEIERTRKQLREPRSLIDWTETLQGLATRLFGDDDNQNLIELRNILAELGERFGAHHSEEVIFDVIRSWLTYQAEATSSLGFLRGRLTFCSMLPMRSIPFSVICLLGLNDGAFPKQDNFSPFDLLAWESRKGDRSRRGDDRYQFLEAILAARRTLYISYIGQSIRTNEARPPSPVVAELSEILEGSYNAWVLQRHPLQPFSSAYFRPDSPLFSYSRYHCRIAEALLKPPDSPAECWLAEPVSVQARSELSLDELARFVSGPQSFFVRDILGLRLRLKDDTIEDHEPFSLEGLEHYLVNQEIVGAMKSGRPGHDLVAELQSSLHWPLGYPGEYQFENTRGAIGEFVQRLQQIEPGTAREPFLFDIALECCRLSGAMANLYDGGLLFYRYSNLKGKDLLHGWLCHLVAGVVLGHGVATRIVARDRTIVIDAQVGNHQDLLKLLDLFQQGCRYPSSLFVEPAFAYCEQLITNRKRGTKDPLERARESLQKDINKGYTPELEILFPGRAAASLLDDRFETLCNDFFFGIRDRVAVFAGEFHD